MKKAIKHKNYGSASRKTLCGYRRDTRHSSFDLFFYMAPFSFYKRPARTWCNQEQLVCAGRTDVSLGGRREQTCHRYEMKFCLHFKKRLQSSWFPHKNDLIIASLLGLAVKQMDALRALLAKQSFLRLPLRYHHRVKGNAFG
jgi:hypothetical protein